MWERDAEEARSKIAEGRKAWQECLRELPEVLKASPSADRGRTVDDYQEDRTPERPGGDACRTACT